MPSSAAVMRLYAAELSGQLRQQLWRVEKRLGDNG
jgi:hypothetical protein